MVTKEKYSNHSALPAEWVQGYARNFTIVVKVVQQLFPGSYIVAHTAPRVRHDENGRTIAQFVGHQVRLAQQTRQSC